MGKIIAAAIMAALVPAAVFAENCDLPQDQLFTPIDTHGFSSIDCNSDQMVDLAELSLFLTSNAGAGAPEPANILSMLDHDQSGTIDPLEMPSPSEIADIIGSGNPASVGTKSGGL